MYVFCSTAKKLLKLWTKIAKEHHAIERQPSKNWWQCAFFPLNHAGELHIFRWEKRDYTPMMARPTSSKMVRRKQPDDPYIAVYGMTQVPKYTTTQATICNMRTRSTPNQTTMKGPKWPRHRATCWTTSKRRASSISGACNWNHREPTTTKRCKYHRDTTQRLRARQSWWIHHCTRG